MYNLFCLKISYTATGSAEFREVNLTESQSCNKSFARAGIFKKDDKSYTFDKITNEKQWISELSNTSVTVG